MILLKETSGDTLIGAIDGVNTVYEVSYDYQDTTVIVYVNGQRKIESFDDGWDLLPPRQVQLKKALRPGDTVEIEYGVPVTGKAGGGALGGIPSTESAGETLPHIALESDTPGQRIQNLEPRHSIRSLAPSILARGLKPVIFDSRITPVVDEETGEIVALQSEVICQPTDQVNRWVYIIGPKSGDRFVVEQADPNDPTKVPAWGILIEKQTSTTGIVHWFGLLADQVTGLSIDVGDRVLWLGAGGTTAQTPPGGGAYKQALGTVLDPNVILVEPDWEELPIPVYVSHFNTADGSNDTRLADISTTPRNISDGLAHFDSGSWAAGTEHPAVRTTVHSWTTPAPFSIINDTATIFEAIVYGADGAAVLASHQVTLTGDGVSNNAGVTITVSDWAADINKFKANVQVDIDLAVILPDGGRWSLLLRHTNGSEGVYTYQQPDVFYDSETNSPVLTGVSVGETAGSVVTRHLSGVEYYTLGSAFTVDIADIDHLNDETYPDTQVDVQGGSYGVPALALSGPQLAGWSDVWNNLDAAFQKTDWEITQANLTVRTMAANIRARAKDWVDGPWVDSPDAGILIETHPDNNTRTVERFYGETWRCPQTANFDAPAARSWNSEAVLGVSDALFFDGGCEQNTEDWGPYAPNPGAQPDYTGQNATQYLIREFQHDGSASSGFELNISAAVESLEYKLAKAWDGTTSGGTVWIDATTAYNASLWNNGNPSGGSGGRVAAGRYTFGTNNIINCSDTLYVRIGLTSGQRIEGPMTVVFD